MLINLIEECVKENRYDFVRDIIIRYKDVKRINAYMLDTYWSNINSVKAYYDTNMDFLKKDVRDFFFSQEPMIKSKFDDLPSAKYNTGFKVSNSLIAGAAL